MLDFGCLFPMHTIPVLVTVNAGTWQPDLCDLASGCPEESSSVLGGKPCFGPDLSPSFVSQQGGMENRVW